MIDGITCGKVRRINGMSVLEVLFACVIFVLAFVPMLRMFTGSGLSQQRMIRDFPVAYNIVERIMNTVENDIAEGRYDQANYTSSDPEGLDVTAMVLENSAVFEALKKFLGNETGKSTKFILRCEVKMLVKPTSDANIIEIRLKFRWADRKNTQKKGFRHCIELNMLKNKI